MKQRRSFNPKRRLRGVPATPTEREALTALAKRARYVGSPLHKRNPGDFGLMPPAAPRPGKTLCDGIVDRLQEAQHLLAEGIRRGLVSEQEHDGWPQNVWAVTDGGEALEAELDNREQGTYHGFPMGSADPLRDDVLERWGPAS